MLGVFLAKMLTLEFELGRCKLVIFLGGIFYK